MIWEKLAGFIQWQSNDIWFYVEIFKYIQEVFLHRWFIKYRIIKRYSSNYFIVLELLFIFAWITLNCNIKRKLSGTCGIAWYKTFSYQLINISPCRYLIGTTSKQAQLDIVSILHMSSVNKKVNVKPSA